MEGQAARSARAQTDARLRTERAKTDDELARRARAAEHEADEVLQRARSRATEVLQLARERADQRMLKRRLSPTERGAARSERAREDAVVRKDYARADEVLAYERAERARLVSELLSHERHATDRSLLLERIDADDILGRRDDFLAMVSHDLRNDLIGIALSVGELLGNARDDDSGQKIFRWATNIQRINVRMSRLIGDLLDVVSIEAGKFKVVPENQDVDTAVDEVIESFAAIASAKGVELKVTRIERSFSARFDRHRIQQVLGNLLTNALKYTGQGGTVAVRTERDGDRVCFSVADEGPGIAAYHLDTIFDRYAQGTRQHRAGLGLGLYIARRIVEAHHGKIWAESQRGRGSTFYFSLPLRPAPGGGQGPRKGRRRG